MFRAFTGPVGLYRAYSSIIVAIRCITGPGYSSPWPREESNVISGPGIGDRPPSKQLEGLGTAISPLLWTQPAAFALDEIHLRQGYARLCKAMQGYARLNVCWDLKKPRPQHPQVPNHVFLSF